MEVNGIRIVQQRVTNYIMEVFMKRIIPVFAAVLSFTIIGHPGYGQQSPFTRTDFTPQKTQQPYQHVIALGANRPFSGGSNALSPVFAYMYYGEKLPIPDLYAQFTITTTRVFAIIGLKTSRYFFGVKPLIEHSTYGGWRMYKYGYDDKTRDIRGNNAGVGAFFQYSFLKNLSMKASFHPSYHFYKMPLLSPNVKKYVQKPNNHFQVKPGIELSLNDVQEKSLNRIKHGYIVRVEYQYARRIGYGTWYDYDRLIFKEKYEQTWYPVYGNGSAPWNGWAGPQGIMYKSTIRDTHRLYFSAGLYYNFEKDINILFDYYGGYFAGVDRNNAEQIGYYLADNAVMPGYYNTEFQSQFYMIARLQIGLPIPFWNTRIQPGFNMLYMPKTNEVVGIGRGSMPGGLLYQNVGALANQSYPRRLYKSVSCTFSTQLGNLVPVLISYAYGMDADRAKSSFDVYLSRVHLGKMDRGNHEFQVVFLMAFGKTDSGDEKK
jgi:hypothetical protein